MAWEFAEFIINDDGIAQFIAAGWQLIGIRQTTRRARRYRVAVMRRPKSESVQAAEVKELVRAEDVVAAR